MTPYRRISFRSLATLVVVLGAGLAASSWWEHSKVTQRQQAFAALPLSGPVVREIATAEGTMLEVRMPVDPMRLGVTEVQTCYVWRDARVASASMSCVAPTTPN